MVNSCFIHFIPSSIKSPRRMWARQHKEARKEELNAGEEVVSPKHLTSDLDGFSGQIVFVQCIKSVSIWSVYVMLDIIIWQWSFCFPKSRIKQSQYANGEVKLFPITLSILTYRQGGHTLIHAHLLTRYDACREKIYQFHTCHRAQQNIPKTFIWQTVKMKRNPEFQDLNAVLHIDCKNGCQLY